MGRKNAGLEAFALTCPYFSDKVYFKNLKFYIICHYFHFATKTEIPGFFANLAGLLPLPFLRMRPQAGKFLSAARLKQVLGGPLHKISPPKNCGKRVIFF